MCSNNVSPALMALYRIYRGYIVGSKLGSATLCVTMGEMLITKGLQDSRSSDRRYTGHVKSAQFGDSPSGPVQ